MEPHGADDLSIPEKKALLQIARNSIVFSLTGIEQEPPHKDFAIFHENRGAFVTLHKQGQLRGCIGYLLPILPLMEAVEEMAEAAALRDTRFPAVKPAEIDQLDIEISVLSPMYIVESTDDIVVGTHGLYVKKGMYSGLLLPQVATEYNWDALTFLQQTCKKAGLPTDAWQDDATVIHKFSAHVFSEHSVA